MKTLKFVVVGMMLILAGALQGQSSVRVHIGTPPAWGPAGYNNVRYYYLPDVEAYYDVQTAMFIYMSGEYMGSQILFARSLPELRFVSWLQSSNA